MVNKEMVFPIIGIVVYSLAALVYMISGAPMKCGYFASAAAVTAFAMLM